MLNIRPFIRRSTSLEWNLDHIRCEGHKTRTIFCDWIVNTEKSKKVIIHGKTENLEVENYTVYCEERSSKKFTLLQHSQKFLLDPSSEAFVYVEREPIYKIKSGYINHSLLIYLNEISINSGIMMIGMHCIVIL